MDPGLRTNRADWIAGASAGLVALAFAPLTFLHLRELWNRPHYEFVSLLLPAATALLWRETRNLGRLEPGDRSLAVVLGAGVWGLLALAVLLVSTTLSAIAALAALPTVAYALGGRRLALACAPACVLLVLAIPPPFGLDFTLVGKLQGLVSRNAGELLDVLKIDHFMEGNVIDLGTRTLLVDQACSGVYSLFTLTAGTLLYALWFRAGWPRTVLLLASAIFWVIAGNILRVVTIALLATRFGIDATAGMKHTALGLVGFSLMVAMVACTDRLLAFARSLGRILRFLVVGTRRTVARYGTWRLLFGRSIKSARRGKTARRAKNPGTKPTADSVPTVAVRVPAAPSGPTVWPDPRRTWIGAPAAGAAFALLLLPQARMPGHDWGSILADRQVEEQAFARLGADALPERIAGFQRVHFSRLTRDHDLTWGEHSRSWSLTRGDQRAVVSLDYPFVGWHELTDCYIGRGFRVTSRRVVAGPSGGATVLVELRRSDGQSARLVYGLFDRQARALDPPLDRDLTSAVRERLSSWRFATTPRPDLSGPTHQIQVLSDATDANGAPSADDLLNLHREAVAVLHRSPISIARRAGATR